MRVNVSPASGAMLVGKNQTERNVRSRFGAICGLDPLDHFVKRTLRCRAYLRYVDDFALFANDKRSLWQCKGAIIEFLARYRLTIHESSCQVTPTVHGAPWLGFVVYPTHRLVKARKVRHASRRLRQRYAAWRTGAISFATLDASVQGWINHVRFADTWGLRRHVLATLAARSARRAISGQRTAAQ
ncbi:MAG: RNA-directed DNA polymerase [Pseudomonadota bacterium]